MIVKKIVKEGKEITNEDIKIILDGLKDYISEGQDDIVSYWLEGDMEEYLRLDLPYTEPSAIECYLSPMKFEYVNSMVLDASLFYSNSNDTIWLEIANLDPFINALFKYSRSWRDQYEYVSLKDCNGDPNEFVRKCKECMEEYSRNVEKIFSYLKEIAKNANALQRLLYTMGHRPEFTDVFGN